MDESRLFGEQIATQKSNVEVDPPQLVAVGDDVVGIPNPHPREGGDGGGALQLPLDPRVRARAEGKESYHVVAAARDTELSDHVIGAAAAGAGYETDISYGAAGRGGTAAVGDAEDGSRPEPLVPSTSPDEVAGDDEGTQVAVFDFHERRGGRVEEQTGGVGGEGGDVAATAVVVVVDPAESALPQIQDGCPRWFRQRDGEHPGHPHRGVVLDGGDAARQ